MVLSFILIPQIACYALYYKALLYIEPTYLALTYSLDPVTASILGLVVLKEKVGVSQVLE